MCGIVGGVSKRNLVPFLLEGLESLEYRGYDSAGIALISARNKQNVTQETAQTQYDIINTKCINRVAQLKVHCHEQNIEGHTGIAHTRWATHGGVTINNAHPHISNNLLALVHNGIIENYLDIKKELLAENYIFQSDTDSEVIVHLIHKYYILNNHQESKQLRLLDAIRTAIKRLHGAFAIGVILKDDPSIAIVASFGAPLLLGIGQNEMLFASDIVALLSATQKVIYLQDGDIALLKYNSYEIYNKRDVLVNRDYHISKLSNNNNILGEYRHYMQKEIFEQPYVIANTINAFGGEFDADKLFGVGASNLFTMVNKVQIIACGTSYNAGMIAKYWIEDIANIECSVDIASEYRYRNSPISPNTLFIAISQSGETADTVASIKHILSRGIQNILTICNVDESSLVRLAKFKLLTKAGPEIGVASTKAFTTQLIALIYLAHTLASAKNCLSKEMINELNNQLHNLPTILEQVLLLEDDIKLIAKELTYKSHALFLGRHMMYPVAMEAALKIKEVSYIHAESYPAGELKHGPLALIDRDMPVFILLPSLILPDKMQSNLQEVLARGGMVYLIIDNVTTEQNQAINYNSCHKILNINLPSNIHKILLPIIYTLPLQLLAYHTALFKGTDVDKPRNLAKSVTVE